MLYQKEFRVREENQRSNDGDRSPECGRCFQLGEPRNRICFAPSKDRRLGPREEREQCLTIAEYEGPFGMGSHAG